MLDLPSPCQMRYHRSENPGVGARGITGHRMHSQALFIDVPTLAPTSVITWQGPAGGVFFLKLARYLVVDSITR